MNPDRFDALSKTFATSVSRRSALLRGGTGVAAALLAVAGLRRGGAAAPMNNPNWYSVIRKYQLTGPTTSIEQQLRTGLLPQLSQADGFVEYFVVSSPNNVLTTVSVFTNQAKFQTADQATSAWVTQNLSNLPNPTETTMGNVTVFAAAAAQICPAPVNTATAVPPTATPTVPPASPSATPCTGIGCPCNGGVQNACAPGLVCCQSQMNGGPIPGGAGMCAAADACGPQGTSTAPPTMPPTAPPTEPPTAPPSMEPTQEPTTT